MSYSFREPEWEVVCECRYDEVRDRMDREDCPFHSEMVENSPEVEVQPVKRKPPTVASDVREDVA